MIKIKNLQCTALRGYGGHSNVQNDIRKECEQMFSLILCQLRPILPYLIGNVDIAVRIVSYRCTYCVISSAITLVYKMFAAKYLT